MFVQAYTALMSHYRTESIALSRPVGALRARAESDALQAMQADMETMSLSDRLKHPGRYASIQKKRRESLLSLLLVEPTTVVLERIVDLICAITEESAWSRTPTHLPFEDENHPGIDLQCAETAVLFGWAYFLLSEKLDACVLGRMRSEVRRRIFKPILVHDDYSFMHGKGVCPMTIAADLLLAALLLEDDEARAGRLVKPVLKMLDDACIRHGRELVPLEEAVTDISAVSDLVRLLRDMTRSFVDLSDSIPTGDWLDEILCSWIQDDLFNNPAGETMQPALSGSDIFRIGEIAGDEPLVALGAHLYHKNHIPAVTVTGRILEPAFADRLESTFAKPQRLRYAVLRNNLLMAARIPGLYCSLHAGGGRANAGDIVLFADNMPILTDGGSDCPAHSLPIIAGQSQKEHPSRPCIADFESREDREIMSVELTHAYPAECGLRSYQRTALVLRAEHAVRIVDAIDLAQPAPVTFRFVCAAKPTIVSSAVRLGSVRMTWEGSFSINATPLGGNLTLIELTTTEPVRQAFFTFNFEHA